MARDLVNTGGYLPLFAGTEVVRRTPGARFRPGDMLDGVLPPFIPGTAIPACGQVLTSTPSGGTIWAGGGGYSDCCAGPDTVNTITVPPEWDGLPFLVYGLTNLGTYTGGAYTRFTGPGFDITVNYNTVGINKGNYQRLQVNSAVGGSSIVVRNSRPSGGFFGAGVRTTTLTNEGVVDPQWEPIWPTEVLPATYGTASPYFGVMINVAESFRFVNWPSPETGEPLWGHTPFLCP